MLAEFRLAVSADLPRDDLGRNLLMLAQAGLHGMVTELLRFELNGQPIPDVQPSERPDATLLRPPPDPRVQEVSHELRRLSRQLDAALGSLSSLDGGGRGRGAGVPPSTAPPPITLDDEAGEG